MDHPHPWRALRGMTQTYLHWRTDLPENVLGATDGQRIWMRAGLSQVQSRCVLAHELEHVKRGHNGCQPDAVESVVRHHAARYLLPDVRDVADALAWAGGHSKECADALWVTEATLRARLDRRHLHPAELAIIRERLGRIEFSA